MSNFVPGRRGYEYFTQSDFRGGINHEEENAVPGQVLEARNVWSPLGRPETRPGYFGVGQFEHGDVATDGTFNEAIVLAKEIVATSTFTFVTYNVPAGTAALDVSGMLAQNAAQLGDSFYIGFPAKEFLVVQPPFADTLCPVSAAVLNITNANIDQISFKASYYDGTKFTYLPSAVELVNQATIPSLANNWRANFPVLSTQVFPVFTSFDYMSFQAPADWANFDLDGSGNDLFWLKFTLFDAGGASITTATSISHNVATGPVVGRVAQGQVRGAVVAQLPSQRLYLAAYNGHSFTVPSRFYTKADDARRGNQYIYEFNETPSREPCTWAIIPQFNIVYCANDYEMTQFVPGNTQPTPASIEAQVEDNPQFVGPGAVYDTRITLQASAFPKCKFIMWYQGLLWLANIEGKEYQIKWSGSTGALEGGIFDGYRVFPDETTFANIEDDDNSPITGMSSLNEQALIFKNNSIWRMVAAGTKDNKLALFQPVKVSNGVGCISNQSIGKTPLGLMFLGEDGVYLFDGVRTSKMSVAIDDTIHSMNYNAAHLAAGVTWRDNNVYFLSLPIEGAGENNTVIVFDYKYVMRSNEGGVAPAVWIFDNVPAQTWMLDEAESDLEVLYFFDSKGAMYQMDYRRHDNGAPTLSFVQTRRQGFGDFITKSARELRVNASNATTDLEYELIGDDRNYGSDGDISFFDFAETPVEGAVFDVDPFSRKARRERRVAVRENGEWFTVKVEDNEKNQRLELHRISIGYVRKGPR